MVLYFIGSIPNLLYNVIACDLSVVFKAPAFSRSVTAIFIFYEAGPQKKPESSLTLYILFLRLSPNL